MTSFSDLARGLPSWALLGFGMITGSLRSVWSFLYEHTIGYAMTRVTLSLTVEDNQHEDAYLWLSYWVESKLRQRRVNALLVRSDADSASTFRLIPEYGTYYLSWKKRLMVVTHSKEHTGSGRSARQVHTLRLQVWLARDRASLFDILEEAKQAFDRLKPAAVEFHRTAPYGDWRLETIAPRTLDSIYLPQAQLLDLTADIETYLSSKSIYLELGIPYRRGYQLAGPPGTGKSTLILALASHFQLPLYSLALTGRDLSAAQLADLLADCRKPAIVTFEDVDRLELTTRNSGDDEGITMADLLNLIDGVGASEDRILFITANHPERLNPALVRAGRIDRKFFIDYAGDEDLQRFHARVSAHFALDPWPEFRAGLPLRCTIADAQALAFQRRPRNTLHPSINRLSRLRARNESDWCPPIDQQ